MKDQELEKMPLDDLWGLHERIVAMLDRKLQEEKRKLEGKLGELGRKLGGTPVTDVRLRRPYPKVEPKFRNPNDPTVTWSGRGKQPIWIAELLAAGRQLEDFKI